MKKTLLQIVAVPITIGMLIISCLLPTISPAQITNLLDFTGTNGSIPEGHLISDGTFLYGTTSGGGSSTICSGGCGTIFKIKPDGTGYVDILDFNGTNGSEPHGSLIYDGTFLYGTTYRGGSSTICWGGVWNHF